MTRPSRTLADLRATALRRLGQLDDELRALRSDRGADSADDEHDPEGVTLSAEWSRLAGLRAAAHADIDAIDAAAQRAADGSYGVCVDCGQPIPPARLEARPTATRCVPCETRAGG
jgi:RNA polymerase-binding transcription factor DksA